MVIAGVCVLASSTIGGWYWQNPKPTGNDLYDVWFSGQDTGYACGVLTLLKTCDGGGHWDTLHGPSGSCIQFPEDSRVGFTALGRSIYRTVDAGQTWQPVFEASGTNTSFTAIDFPVDAETGYAACAYTADGGQVYKTTDGGTNWSLMLDEPYYWWNMSGIEFPRDCRTGYVLGSGSYGNTSLAKTTNGGTDWTWLSRGDTSGNGGSISFPTSPDTGYYANGCLMLKTTDGGVNWDTLPLRPQLPFGQVLFSTCVDTGFVLEAPRRLLYRTADAGASWDTIAAPGYPSRVHFPEDNRRGRMVGAYGMLAHTTDRGTTWTREERRVTLEHAILFDVQFPVDKRTGFACGEPGVFLKTTDGGRDWAQAGITDTLCGFHALDFPVDAQTGYLAGYVRPRAAVLRTTDGGSSWDTVLTDGTANSWFHDIQFPRGLDTGYALQYPNCRLWRTTDGGDSWTIGYPVAHGYLTALDFPTDATTGYVVGYNGSVARTTDAGLHWDDVRTPQSYNHFAVQFPTGPDTGWVVGSSMFEFYRTTDRGQTWQEQGVYGNQYFDAIEFPVDSRLGYVVGDEGSLFTTTDAGEHWQWFPTCAGRPLYALCFPVDTDTGWAVGMGGVIISTHDGVGGIGETPNAEARATNRMPTVVRGVLFLPEAVGGERLAVGAHLLDISGRKVLDLHPGANDIRHVSPGVYYIVGNRMSATARVVVAH
jgi:photosystem II stability/assembly factor-like uncharacterized protein